MMDGNDIYLIAIFLGDEGPPGLVLLYTIFGFSFMLCFFFPFMDTAYLIGYISTDAL